MNLWTNFLKTLRKQSLNVLLPDSVQFADKRLNKNGSNSSFFTDTELKLGVVVAEGPPQHRRRAPADHMTQILF